MNRRGRRFALILPALVAVLACAAAAQDGKSVVLRLATAAPQRSVWGMQLERWSAAVGEESRGGVTLQVFYGSQLGADADIVQQVARGRVDMAGVSSVFAALLVPELQLLALPTYFRSAAESDCVLDSALTKTIAQRLADKGIHLYGWIGVGTIDMIGRQAFTRPADLAGTKAGTYGTHVGTLVWEAFNANPTPTSNTEIAPAFQTGLIDVAATSAAFYVASGLNRVAPVMSRAELFIVPTMILVNKATWDRLDADHRAAIDRAHARVPVSQLRREAREFEAKMLEVHVRGGGQLVELTDGQRDAFRSVLVPIWPRMVQRSGPEGQRFFESMEAARKACEGGGPERSAGRRP